MPLQATGASPAQLMLGRQIRSTLPTLEENLQPAWPDLQKVRQTDSRAKLRYSQTYNARYKARPLPELQPGTCVSVKLDNERGWTKCATVVRKCHTPLSYIVQTEQGELRTNRHHLRPICGGPQTTQREQVPLGHNTHTNKDSDTLVTYPRPDILTQGDQGPVTTISTVLVFPETQRSSGRAVKPPDRYGEYV